MSACETFLDGRVVLHAGDCLDVLATLEPDSIDSVVCDPPYGLEFMGREWDAPWQVSSESALFGERDRKTPGWGTTRNPNCTKCHGRLRGAKKCSCDIPSWDENPVSTRLRQMSAFQKWCELWARAVLRVLKPGGHVVAFGGTRTYHRMACAIEDAGFEIRDQLAWCYGSGFPKSHDISKAIDKAAGVERSVIASRLGRPGVSISGANYGQGFGRKYEGRDDRPNPALDITASATDDARQWEGWGTALKPAWEPIVLARKPLIGTVAENVLKHGTGGLNIDGCRIAGSKPDTTRGAGGQNGRYGPIGAQGRIIDDGLGRWPANLVHDGSPEVLAAFPSVGDSHPPDNAGSIRSNKIYGADIAPRSFHSGFSDSGSAARFFYTAKADSDDRLGSKHPTVKPVDLMQWLVRLITPPGGVVLDPFAGTGTTGEAAFREGCRAILIEREPEYREDIARRMALCLAGPDERARESIKARLGDKPQDHGPLFAEIVA